MHRKNPTPFLLLVVPLLLAFHVADESPPYEAAEPLPRLSVHIPADRIKDPGLRVAALQLEGRLEERCAEDAETWRNVQELVADLNLRVVDLGGRSLVFIRRAEERLERLELDAPDALTLGHAVNELQARQTLEARHRSETAVLFGRTHDDRYHSREWCHHDIGVLARLQHRHRTLARAVLQTIEALNEPEHERFYLDLLFPP